MQTAQATITRTLVDAEDLERFRRTSGRAGLEALIKALRSLLKILLTPFRAIARLKYGSGNAEGEIDLAEQTGGKPLAGMDQDEVALPNSAPHEAAMAAQLLDGTADSLQLELAGEQKELDELMPMLQRHMDLLLKERLPAQVSDEQVIDRLSTMAEAAERGRYAYSIAARQVDQVLDHLAAMPQYVGMSQRAITELVLMGVKTKEGRALYKDGTPEATLLRQMAFRDHVSATYAAHVNEIALLVLRDSDEARSEAKLEKLLHAASQTSDRLMSRFPHTSGAAREQMESLEAAVRKAMHEGVDALEKAGQAAAAARVASAPPVVTAAPVPAAKPSAPAVAAASPAGGFSGSAARMSQAEREAERQAIANDLDDADMVMS